MIPECSLCDSSRTGFWSPATDSDTGIKEPESTILNMGRIGESSHRKPVTAISGVGRAVTMGPPWCCSGKEPACRCRRRVLDPWVGKIPWSRKWQPTAVFLPGKSHGQRSLVAYSPQGHKESDTTEQHFHFHLDYILLEDQTNGLVGVFLFVFYFCNHHNVPSKL